MVVWHLRVKALSMSCMLIECDILVSLWEHQPRPWVWTDSAGPWVKQREEGKQSPEPGGGGTNARRGRGALTHSEVHCPYRLFSTDPVHQARDFSHAWHFATPRLPGSSVRGILQARILEWVAMPSSRGSSNPGIEHSSLMSPALAGGSFTTRVTSQCRRLQANILSTPRDHCLRTSPNHSCSILFL